MPLRRLSRAVFRSPQFLTTRATIPDSLPMAPGTTTRVTAIIGSLIPGLTGRFIHGASACSAGDAGGIIPGAAGAGPRACASARALGSADFAAVSAWAIPLASTTVEGLVAESVGSTASVIAGASAIAGALGTVGALGIAVASVVTAVTAKHAAESANIPATECQWPGELRQVLECVRAAPLYTAAEDETPRERPPRRKNPKSEPE